MTSHYSNTSLTSSVQLEPDSSFDNMLSGFSLIENKKNGSVPNYPTSQLLQFRIGDEL